MPGGRPRHGFVASLAPAWLNPLTTLAQIRVSMRGVSLLASHPGLAATWLVRQIKLGALVTRQFGVVSRGQLYDLGYDRGAIGHWLKTGRLVRLHQGVYAVGHERLTMRGRWMAATLTGGPGAVLSHFAAARLLDLHPSNRATIEITVDAPPRKRRRGRLLVNCMTLHQDDVTTVDGIAVTSVTRTLVDLAGHMHPEQLRRCFEQAQRMDVLDLAALRATIDRSAGRKGVHLVRTLGAEDHSTAARARSVLEARFLDFIRERGLPIPTVNCVVEGYDVDAHWPGTRLVVELDSFLHHSGRTEFDKDREKWIRLKALGYEVVSVTDPLLRSEPDLLEQTIRTQLGSGRTRTEFNSNTSSQ